MLNIALFGPPGAGKGTQSTLLAEKYNLTYVATGDLLRQEIKEGTELGELAKSTIERGGLVSDEIIVQLIENRITMNLSNSNGILFDGFPRTIVQAYILEGLLLKMNSSLAAMFCLEVPKDILLKRMLERSKTSNRSDDTEEVIEVRLNEYQEKTVPVIDFYKERGKYNSINGIGNIDSINKRITTIVSSILKKKLLNIVLLGPPGGGKGTQGIKIAKKYGLGYISTGKLLRREVKENTEIGKKAKPFLEVGNIVPDELAIQLIEREVKLQHEARGFVFKGFPRTIVQAYILDGILKKMDSSVSVCYNLNIPTLTSVKRLAERAKTPQARSYDKSIELIISRLEEHEQRTSLVAKFYKNQKKSIKINGQGNQEEIFDNLSSHIEKAFKQIR